MEYEGNSDTNYCWFTWKGLQRSLEKRQEELEIKVRIDAI